MRHGKRTRKFGRQRSHYKATLRHLAAGVILNKSIVTTKEKAKETSRIADKLVTLGKNNTPSSQRKAFSLLQSRDLVSILFNEIAPLFKDRNGGYTRVILSDRRRGDNAQMAILEFVEKPKVEPQKKKEKKKEKTAAPEVKPKPEKKQIQKKPKAPKDAAHKKPIEPKKVEKEPEQPKEDTTKKPGFFKKIFGHKKEQ